VRCRWHCWPVRPRGGAEAAVFGLVEQSASQVGNSVAGGAASAEDASTVWFNPAGMLRLDRSNVAGGVHFISPKLDFNNNGSRYLGVPGGVPPLSGSDGGGAGNLAATANLYYTRHLDDRTVWGIGVNTPFGLRTKYDSDFIGRYQALDSQLTSVNINPSLAYKLDDRLSIGGGIDINYLQAKLQNAVNTGLIALGGGVPPLTALGLPDTIARVKGSDWGLGINFGLLYQLDAATRLGLAYRSQIKHTLSGDVNYTQATPTGAGVIAAAGLRNGNIKANLTLPDSLSMSAYHDVDDRLALMGDLTFTRWSKIQEIRIRYDTGQGDTVTPENWRNALRVSLGANYRLNEAWLLRCGVALDQTPVTDPQYRTPRLPDANRKWLSVGTNYKLSPAASIDFAYAHLFIGKTDVNATSNESAAALRTVLVGNYDEAIDVVSLQLNYRY
jgi:long-chain fatty acid transport protein